MIDLTIPKDRRSVSSLSAPMIEAIALLVLVVCGLPLF